MICIAGKGDIAVHVLELLLADNSIKRKIVALSVGGDSGVNHFQKSLRYAALKHGIKILDNISQLYAIESLVFISLEYDKIIKPDRFEKDALLFNIHFSLLPAYKGMYTSALPILMGEKESGVTLHFIDKGIDTGNIIDQAGFPIPSTATCRDLYFLYMKYAFKLFKRNYKKMIEGKVKATPQSPEGSSYFSKKTIDYRNLKIDINQTAFNIKNQIRAFCFREYQLPLVFDKWIYKAEILSNKSSQRAGTIVVQNNEFIDIATIDYDCRLYIDYFDKAMSAIRQGKLEDLKAVINYIPDINEKDKNGWSLIIVAAYHNQADMVEFLLSKGASPNDVNYKGTSVLMYAKDGILKQNAGKDLTLIKILLKNGAIPEHKDQNGKMLINYITETEFPELCQLLSVQ